MTKQWGCKKGCKKKSIAYRFLLKHDLNDWPLLDRSTESVILNVFERRFDISGIVLRLMVDYLYDLV